MIYLFMAADSSCEGELNDFQRTLGCPLHNRPIHLSPSRVLSISLVVDSALAAGVEIASSHLVPL